MALKKRLGHLRFRYATGWRDAGKPVQYYCPMHCHSTFEIVYHPSGRGITTTERGERLPFVPDSVIVYPPSLAHDQRMDAPGIDVCVHFSVEGDIPEALKRPLIVEKVHDGTLITELSSLACPEPTMSALRRLMFGHRTATVVLALMDLIRSGDKSGERTRTPPWHAAHAHALIRERYSAIQGLDEVAREIGLSHDRLRHVFRTQYGVGLQQFLQQTRIERAAELLIHSRLPLKTICGMCGFANERYLCFAFKRWTGTTPGVFRSRHHRHAKVDRAGARS
jgi:AraC-like DNA-binding protein